MITYIEQVFNRNRFFHIQYRKKNSINRRNMLCMWLSTDLIVIDTVRGTIANSRFESLKSKNKIGEPFRSDFLILFTAISFMFLVWTLFVRFTFVTNNSFHFNNVTNERYFILRFILCSLAFFNKFALDRFVYFIGLWKVSGDQNIHDWIILQWTDFRCCFWCFFYWVDSGTFCLLLEKHTVRNRRATDFIYK